MRWIEYSWKNSTHSQAGSTHWWTEGRQINSWRDNKVIDVEEPGIDGQAGPLGRIADEYNRLIRFEGWIV